MREMGSHIVPGFDTLVTKVREGFARDETTSALLNMKLALFIHNLPLAYHHERSPTTLHSLKDVILQGLREEGITVMPKLD